MTVRGIYARTVRTYWRRAGFLLSVGALVFIPLGLLDALSHQLGAIRSEKLSELQAAAASLGTVVQTVTSMLGEVFYSGAIAVTIAAGEGRPRPALRHIGRRLAYGRLVVVDLLLALGTGIGVILLVIPGLVFFVWFALSGPVVELEGARVRAAFARSRQLVRGHFWTVFAVLVPITVIGSLLSDLALEAAPKILGSHFVGEWLGGSVANVLLSPLYAVAAVLLTVELSGSGEPDR